MNLFAVVPQRLHVLRLDLVVGTLLDALSDLLSVRNIVVGDTAHNLGGTHIAVDLLLDEDKVAVGNGIGSCRVVDLALEVLETILNFIELKVDLLIELADLTEKIVQLVASITINSVGELLEFTLLLLERVFEVIKISIVKLLQLLQKGNSLYVVVDELLKLLALLGHARDLGVVLELGGDGSRLVVVLLDIVSVDELTRQLFL